MTSFLPFFWRGREGIRLKRLSTTRQTNLDICLLRRPLSPLEHPYYTSPTIFFKKPVSRPNTTSRVRSYSTSAAPNGVDSIPNALVLKQITLSEGTAQNALSELRVFQTRRYHDHPFLLGFIFAGRMEHQLIFGLEFCSGGDLHSLIYSENSADIIGSFRLFDMVLYLAEICSALRFLHQNNIYHGDVKLANVFIAASGHLKLADFGESRVLPALDMSDQETFNVRRTRTSTHVEVNDFEDFPQPTFKTTLEGIPEESTQDFAPQSRQSRSYSEAYRDDDVPDFSTRVVSCSGTPPYCAPEILFRKPHRFEPDWWSYGVLSCELLTGSTPFGFFEFEDDESPQSQKQMLEMICYQDLKSLFDQMEFPCPRAKSFVESLVKREMNRRRGDIFSCDDPFSGIDYNLEISSHSLFECIDWDTLHRQGYQPPYIPSIPEFLKDPTEMKRPTLLKSKSYYKSRTPQEDIRRQPSGSSTTVGTTTSVSTRETEIDRQRSTDSLSSTSDPDHLEQVETFELDERSINLFVK